MDSSVQELYHILNVGTFTYCLICMEDVCNKLNLQSEENPVKVHLRCQNHQANVKFLFKLCVPDSIDDEPNTEDYFEIMGRSVFDISNLLGQNTCYICCKNEKNLVCLLCHEEVSGIEFPCKKIKKRIICHLQSDKHLQSVKNTNWVYHFNWYKSFFRFHKSLLYCSICKESFQFKESSLLQFAGSHLKNFHLREGVRSIAPGSQDEINASDCAEVVSSSKSSEKSGSCFPPINKKTKSYTCHLCLRDIELIDNRVKYSIEEHCRKHHLKCYQVEGSSLFKDIICFNQRFTNHKVIVKKYPGISTLSNCVPVFKDNSKYIQIFGTICFCSLCSVMVLFDEDPNNCLRNFSTHFHSAEHTKVLKMKGSSGYNKALKKKSKGLKRLEQLPKAKKATKKSKRKQVD